MGRGVKNPERSFGTSVGGLLIVVAALLLWRGRQSPALVAAPVGIVLLALGLLRPMWLAVPSRIWWRIVHALGYVNTRVVLTLLFGLMLVPVSAAMRLAGKDPLALRRAKWRGWTPYSPRYRDPKHYSRMY